MADSVGLAVAVMESPGLKRLQAVEFVRPMRGGSQPWLLRCEDGSYYVVKFRDNPQHVRVLANEMLAGLLAQFIGLPTATPAYIEVADALADSTRNAAGPPVHTSCVPTGPSSGFSSGLHFGSRFPGNPAETLAVEFLPDRILRAVQNLREAFLGALVFDKWTCNCDGRQMVFYRQPSGRGRGYTACLIDHGFCFNDGEWSFPDSAIRSLYPRRLVYESVRSVESFDPFLSRIENLKEAELAACAREIPPDWCDGEPTGPARLMETLYLRRRKLRQALVDVKNSDLRPFPNWK
ncbi:MAG: HipA family kinase [Terriglobia bacterium]